MSTATPASRLSAEPTGLQRWTLGIVLVLSLTCMAMWLGQLPLLADRGLSALTLAILLGMVVGNLRPVRGAEVFQPGIAVIKHYFLRAGIILYGLRLTWQDLAAAGVGAMALDAVMLVSTFGLACWLGSKVFRLERGQVILIGAGSSICGAAAVMATAPVAQGKVSDVAVAVSTVVVFGTLAMFIAPALYQLGVDAGWISADSRRFGLYLGATVHEVAQVVAAGRAVDVAAMDAAVIAKMARVMMLAPFLVALALYLARRREGQPSAGVAGGVMQSMPWFALAFIGLVLVNSVIALPAAWQPWIVQIDTFLLAAAMVALGLTTQVSAIRRAGLKPLLLAGILALWLMFGGAGLAALML